MKLGLSLAVLSLFWFLDSYYLSRERRFVALYNSVRTKNEEDIDFSMETHSFGKTCRWVSTAEGRVTVKLSKHLLLSDLSGPLKIQPKTVSYWNDWWI
jgi:hypothetical protein